MNGNDCTWRLCGACIQMNLAAAALLLSFTAAQAGSKSFVLNSPALETFNGGAYSGSAKSHEGVGLGDTTNSQLVVNFTIPADYKRNSTITIGLRMYGGGSSCGIRLITDGVRRFRNSNAVTTSYAAFAPVNGTDFITSPNDDMLMTRSFKLKPIGNGSIGSGSMRDQIAGDGIVAFITRRGSEDSCVAPLVITSAKITYTTR